MSEIKIVKFWFSVKLSVILQNKNYWCFNNAIIESAEVHE